MEQKQEIITKQSVDNMPRFHKKTLFEAVRKNLQRNIT